MDALDGRIARLIKGTSKMGKELDSLGDVVSFGVAPALIMYYWNLQYLDKFGWFVCLTYVVCVALRLARFEILWARHRLQTYVKVWLLISARSAAAQASAFIPPAFETIRTPCRAISAKLGAIAEVTKSVAKPASGSLALARANIAMVISAR